MTVVVCICEWVCKCMCWCVSMCDSFCIGLDVRVVSNIRSLDYYSIFLCSDSRVHVISLRLYIYSVCDLVCVVYVL